PLAGPNRPAFGPIRIIDLFLPRKACHPHDGRGRTNAGPANPSRNRGFPRSSSRQCLAGATRPAEVCYDRLLATRKAAILKKVKYTGLTLSKAAGVRSSG